MARRREAPRREFFWLGVIVRRVEFQTHIEAMANPFEFIQQVRAEGAKVIWPTRRETFITTGLVLMLVVFTSLFFLVVDEVLRDNRFSRPRLRTRRLTSAMDPDRPNMNMRWYIVHAYSNFEKKVAESIREQASQRGLSEKFEEVLVPTEQVVEMRRGRKINSERKFFPGYVLVKCDLTDEVYHLIKNTPKVTGFLGADKKPMPIPDMEANRIKGQVADGVERPKAAIRFEIGENVRVADGPFASFNGVVEEVDEFRSRVKVAVSIFGRATPVDLEFGQVEKQ